MRISNVTPKALFSLLCGCVGGGLPVIGRTQSRGASQHAKAHSAHVAAGGALLRGTTVRIPYVLHSHSARAVALE